MGFPIWTSRGRSGVTISVLGYSSSEIGDVSQTIVEITFTGNVNATDYKDGWTIKVNAVSETISSAARQDPTNNKVHFTLASAVDINDVITVEYDDDFGDYEDDAGDPLGDIAAKTATNYVGSHLWFDTEESSAWIGAI